MAVLLGTPDAVQIGHAELQSQQRRPKQVCWLAHQQTHT